MKAHATYNFSDEDRIALGHGSLASHGILTQFMLESTKKALPEIRKRYFAEMAKEFAKKAETQE